MPKETCNKCGNEVIEDRKLDNTIWRCPNCGLEEYLSIEDKDGREEYLCDFIRNNLEGAVLTFEGVGAIEKEHEARFRRLLENVENGEVFKRGSITIWKCRNCGHIVVGTEAPKVCPVCNHPQSYFEVKAENY